MAPVFSAVVKFSGTKTCFVSLPANCIRNLKFSQDVPVFEVSYGENCSVFLSCKGGISYSNAARNEIQLSRKYGLMLGLKEDEEVLVQQYDKDVTIAEKVVLEPLTCDDWEILNLNSKTIEASLLGQIRVVWKGQKFPVCAFSSVFSVEVAEVVPTVKPVLLAEWTEVHIIPKERSVPPMNNFSSTSVEHENKVRRKKYSHLKPRHKGNFMSSKDGFLNPDAPDNSETQSIQNSDPSGGVNQTESSSVFSIFQSMVKTVFAHSDEQHSSSSLSPAVDISSDEAESAEHPIKLRLRVIPYSRMSKGKTLPLALQSTTVFISDQTFTSQCQVTEVPLFFAANLTKLLSPSGRFEKTQKSAAHSKSDTRGKHTKEKDGEKKDRLFSTLCVNVVVIRSFDKEYNLPESLHLPLNYIAVPKELKRCLGLEVTSIVHCESVNYRPICIDTLQLYPLSAIPPQVKEEYVHFKFLHWINEALQPNTSLLVSDGTLVSLEVIKGKLVDFVISFGQPDSQETPNRNSKSPVNSSATSSSSDSLPPLTFPVIPRYGYLKGRIPSNITVKVVPFSSMRSKATRSVSLNRIHELHLSVPGLRIEALGGIKSIYEKAMEDFIYWLKLSPIPLIVNDPVLCYGSMLICGPKGVGKSTLADALCRKLSEFPYYVYTKVLDCRPLRGKRVEAIANKWVTALAEAVHREPSVVLFDDLDQLASAPSTPEQEVGPDGLYFSKIAQVFLSLVNFIVCHQNRVVIVATSKSINTLHSSLISTRGCHTFLSIIDIPPPSISEREDILRSLILSKVHLSSDSLQNVSLDDLARSTEGYIAYDLDSLVDKATHAALLRTEVNTQDEDHHDSEQIILCSDDFEVAMEGYTPSSLRGLRLHGKGNKSWKDVGGLHLVKKLIKQIFWWPVKYSKLLSKCPIKPQSNILLYGAPGTGKTLLANVVANECGLNFISVKGPELLSKYIGASEEAVRDLFQRALSAKPCVIFFDEFDSIAPKRGHDSTGVTDRVVNQFLTQMDGVESAQGVYVLAASSRPDLIDPALLRPGRLDKCLNCPLPNEGERLEILSALSSRLTLGDDVNLESIAKTTENFSGADLQALLYSSQLEAFHGIQASKRRLSLDPDEDGDSVNADLVYMPSLLEGPATPAPYVEKKLVQEVNVIKDNIAGRSAAFMSRSCPRKRSFVSLVIQQKHLDKVRSQMKPSVSEKERQRYQAIYEKFVNSHGGDFTPPTTGLKKVTLA